MTDTTGARFQSVATCAACGRREPVVKVDRELWPRTAAVGRLIRRCQAAGHKSRLVFSREQLDPFVGASLPPTRVSAVGPRHATPSPPPEYQPGRRTVRAHRDPTVLHHAGTDRYSTTPGVTVVVDYTPGEGKAAMDALMSAVGEVRKQIEEER